MRRNYISPEYHNNIVDGTLNMIEESNFFSSKMLEIEDLITIDSIDLIWYENELKEQLDLSIESTNNPLVYSPSEDKKLNSKLKINKKTNTEWILEINSKKILENYLFATLKKFRTFEGLKKYKNISNDVDESIKKYIKSNILNRYKYKNTKLYIDYKLISDNDYLLYKNNWNPNINEENIFKDFKTKLIQDKLILTFLQKDNKKYIFDYYYNISFEII